MCIYGAYCLLVPNKIARVSTNVKASASHSSIQSNGSAIKLVKLNYLQPVNKSTVKKAVIGWTKAKFLFH